MALKRPRGSAGTLAVLEHTSKILKGNPADRDEYKKALENTILSDGVKIIIIEPYFDSKTPNAIGRDSGAQVVTLAPSVGGAKGAPVSDYLQLFDYDVKTLVAAFQAAGMKGGA